MKRFDAMVSHFHEALNKAVIDLELQGFVHAHDLKEKILARGGIPASIIFGHFFLISAHY